MGADWIGHLLKSTQSIRAVSWLTVILLMPADAQARPCTIRTPVDLAACVPLGTDVRVKVLAPDREVEGAFVGVSDGQLTLRVGRGRYERLASADISRITWTPENTPRQFVAGLIAGGVTFAVTRAVQEQRTDGPIWAAIIVGSLTSVGFTRDEVVFDRVRPVEGATSVPRDEGVKVSPGAFTSNVTTLAARLAGDEELRVKRVGNSTVSGRFAGIEGRTLRLALADRILDIPEDDLITVERIGRASTKKGVVGGAIVGLLVGVGVAADRRQNSPAFSQTDAILTSVGAAAGGAVVGAVVAMSLRPRELILVRSTPKSGTGGSELRFGFLSVHWSF